MSSYKNTLIKYNPFIYIPSTSNQKTALVLNIGYDLQNLSLGLFQPFYPSFTDFEDCILIKLLLQ